MGLPSILIVEDQADVREMLCIFLTGEGYAVSSADNGRRALQNLQDGLRPGVIVSDLTMPEMDGEQLCRALAADPALAKLPVVLISGESCLPRVATAVGARYLRKPLDLPQLLQLVRSA